MTSYLELNALPSELKAELDKHFDNDESKRRALLAPHCRGRFSAIWPEGMWAWQPMRRFWRRKWARDVRKDDKTFFQSVVEERFPDSPSLFDPSLPFFPTPLTEVSKPIISPWPEVLSDAEYWALVMQVYSGDETLAQNRIQYWVPYFKKALHPKGLQKLRFWHSKYDELADLCWKEEMRKAGDFS